MKKLTAFFMALLPIFVMLLLFVTGIIVKKVDPTVHVDKVEITDSVANVKKPKDDEDPTYQLVSNVLPKIANQEVYWRSTNPEIATVDRNTGVVTGKTYGDTYVIAQSADDPTKEASCKVHVWDDKIHKINVANEDIISYIGVADKQQIEISTVPATDILNPNLKYTSSDPNSLDVTPTGLLIPKNTTEGKSVTVKIEPEDKESTASPKEISVRIGKGVTQIGLSNPSEATTTNKTYNFWNELIVAPEDKNSLQPTDFIFTSDDETAATIDANGLATFKAPSNDSNAAKYPTATFTATYKRDKTLTTSKKITCTCDKFKEVYFTTGDYTCDSYEGSELELSDLKVYTYPEVNNFKDVTLYSSNPKVVDVSKDSDGKPVFKALSCGYAMISATISTGDSDFPTKTDVCNVTVHPKNIGDLVHESEVTLTKDDGYYYPLRNNLNLDKKYPGEHSITWSIYSGTAATLDADNEILHFNQPGTVTVMGKTDWIGLRSFTFDVTCPESITETEVEIPQSETKIVLKAGQLTKFKDWQPQFTESQKNDFDIVKDEGGVITFVPKYGMDIPALKIKSGENERSIRLIVTEKPISLTSDIKPFTTIDNTDYYPYNFKDNANIQVVPSTATMADGQLYSSLIKYQYDCAKETATIDDNEITFTSYGMVKATVTCGDFDPYTYVIKSTYGQLGRFDIVDESSKAVQAYSKLKIDAETSLYTKNSYTSKYKDDIKIESLNNLCDVKYEATGGLLIGGQTKFTITPKKDVFGSDVIRIYTNTYSYYLNIEISPKIKSVKLYYKDSMLDASAETLTYTQKLKLYADITPIAAAKDEDYTVTFNGNNVEHSKGIIDLSADALTAAWKDTNELKFFRKGESDPFATYKINYKNEIPSFVLMDDKKVDKIDALYLASKSTSKIAYVMPEPYGLVDDTFYSSFNDPTFKDGKKESEEAKIDQGILRLSNFPMPVGNDQYTNTLLISQKGKEAIASYPIARDRVSKVVLPKHDNLDESDLKGLQKVHVYGNQSFYTAQEGLINYYKLPIELYDYKGDLIPDMNPEVPTSIDYKALAFKELNQYTTHGTTINYHAKDANNSTGFVEVVFSESSLYTTKEIYDNAFVNGPKNTNVRFTTRSNDSTAQYTFVPVAGVNCYCQEGLGYVQDNEGNNVAAVLQTNFGLIGVEKDNVPLTNWDIKRIATFYGNGYIINFNERVKHHIEIGEKEFYLQFGNLLNVTIQGAEPGTYTNDTKFSIGLEPSAPIEGFGNVVEYSIIRTFTDGAQTTPEKSLKPDKHIKNCLFYNNITSCIFAQNSGNKVYVEDCIFFDSGSFPLMWALGADFYFKGFLDVYNFHNQDMLKNLFGMDFSFLWPTLERVAKASNMIQIGADGRGYINSFGISALTKINFWDQNKGEYVSRTRGLPGAGQYLDKYIDLELKALGVNCSLWGTHDPAHETGAPSYYDEFDKDGNQRFDFLANQMKKIMRPIA